MMRQATLFLLADVGNVARFADRNRFASWTGTARLDASSGQQIRHRLLRAGKRKANHVIHIAAACQIRLDTPGRAYYRRKLAAGKTRMEAMPASNGASPTPSIDSSSRTPRASQQRAWRLAREGTVGRLMYPVRPAHTRTPALRISHFPDPHQRRYPRQHRREGARFPDPFSPPLDVRGAPM